MTRSSCVKNESDDDDRNGPSSLGTSRDNFLDEFGEPPLNRQRLLPLLACGLTNTAVALVKLILLTSPRTLASGQGRANVTILLKGSDEDNDDVSDPERDTRVVLQTTLGALSAQSIVIPRGRMDSDQVALSSPRAGNAASVTAVAEGLEAGSDDVSFAMPFLLIALAAAGGVGGAALRIRRRTRRTLSNRTLDCGTLCPTYRKPFDLFAQGSETGDWLAALDDFRNWLIREAA